MTSKRRQYAEKQFSSAGEAALWDEIYKEARDVFQHHMVMRAQYALRYICKRFPRDTRILDLGCGAGILTYQLAEAGYRPIAVDMSNDMLDLARERCAPFSDRCTFLQADCTDMPFDDNSLDAVISLGMFGYFPESELALREIKRVLTPVGVLMLSVRNRKHQILFDPVGFVTQRRQRDAAAAAEPLSPVAEVPTAATTTATTTVGDAAIDGDRDNRPRPRIFTIDMFERPSYLIKGVERCGYRLRKFDGIGYGPFKWRDQPIFPESLSWLASRTSERVARGSGLIYLTRWFADVSMYVFEVAEKDPRA